MRRGDMAEAQRLLDQLRNILENLQTAQPNSRMTDPLGREMNQAMRGSGRHDARSAEPARRDVPRRPEPAHAAGRPRAAGSAGQQGQRPAGPTPAGPAGQQGDGQEQAENGQGGDGAGSARPGQRQQALRERLQELQRRMRGMGMQGEQGLGDAEQAMREAEGALGQGQDGPAVDAQGRALESLRRGMQGMAQQMQQMQQGEGRGTSRPAISPARATPGQPAGRPAQQRSPGTPHPQQGLSTAA